MKEFLDNYHAYKNNANSQTSLKTDIKEILKYLRKMDKESRASKGNFEKYLAKHCQKLLKEKFEKYLETNILKLYNSVTIELKVLFSESTSDVLKNSQYRDMDYFDEGNPEIDLFRDLMGILYGATTGMVGNAAVAGAIAGALVAATFVAFSLCWSRDTVVDDMTEQIYRDIMVECPNMDNRVVELANTLQQDLEEELEEIFTHYFSCFVKDSALPDQNHYKIILDSRKELQALQFSADELKK